MIELRDYQKKAVRDLKQRMIEMLNAPDDRQRLIFKAPTGSGKTVMVSTVLDELTRELPQNGECLCTRVAWVWIAPNKLHQQSYRSMRNFFSERRSLLSSYADKHGAARNRLGSQFRSVFYKTMEQEWEQNPLLFALKQDTLVVTVPLPCRSFPLRR